MATADLGSGLAIEGTCVLTATAPTRKALSPPDERYTAFTGELIKILRKGVPGGPPLLDMETLYLNLRNALLSRQRPTPHLSNRELGGRIVLVRNQAADIAGDGSAAAPRLDAGSSRSPVASSRPPGHRPSPRVMQHLNGTETYQGEWRRHWISLTSPLAICVGGILTMSYLTGLFVMHSLYQLMWITMIGLLIVLAWGSWKVADWYFDRFVLTDKVMKVVYGVVASTSATAPLRQITDTKFEQSLIGHLLNYGTLEFEAAGDQQALRRIAYLPNPKALHLRIRELHHAVLEVNGHGSSERREPAAVTDDQSE